MISKATEEDLKKLLLEWQSICSSYGDEGTVFASDIKAKIESLINEISQPNFFAYIIKDREELKVVALLNVVHALPKSDFSWLKIFDMFITPEYVLGDGNVDGFKDALVSSIIEPITLLFGEEHGNAKEVKTYGRTDNMIKLFKSFSENSHASEKLKEINMCCLQEGNWLIFRKN